MKRERFLILQTSAIGALILILFAFTQGDKWFVFEEKTQGYKIEFPIKPKVSQQVVDSDIGQLTMNIAMYDASNSDNDDNMVYMVNVTEYPDSLVNSNNLEMVDLFFDGAVNGAVTNVDGKLISEEVIEYSGYPGREMSIDYGNGMAIIKMRMYLVQNTTYMTQTITLTAKKDNESITRFMDSFELLNLETKKP